MFLFFYIFTYSFNGVVVLHTLTSQTPKGGTNTLPHAGTRVHLGRNWMNMHHANKDLSYAGRNSWADLTITSYRIG